MALLKVQSITKRFGGVSALAGVSLEVGDRELVALVGPNGAGKSTLFNIIAGEAPPTSGRVFFKGREITRNPAHQRARLGIARTFQQAALFKELTVLDNVRQSLHWVERRGLLSGLLPSSRSQQEIRRARDRSRELLALFQIERYADALASDLPLGVQKLLSVVVALGTQPTLLLLDEPAAGLSFEEASRLMEVVSEIVRTRCTVLIVEHNMQIVTEYSDRVVVLQFGSVIYDGSPGGLSADQRVVDAYLGTDGTSGL